MAEEVKIDKVVFHDRLGQFISAWKTDKRSGDALFGGVGSIIILMGKAEDSAYQKNNALHVRLTCQLELNGRLMIDTVLAARVRVSCNSLCVYNRDCIRCHYGEEGLVITYFRYSLGQS